MHFYPTGTMNRLLALLLLGLLTVPPLAVTPAMAAPKAELWSRWLQDDPDSKATVDHSAWAEFLQRHVRTGADGVNRVDYAAVGSADRTLLQGYLATLAAVRVSDLGRDEQCAYWINLYNALTLEVVLEHYPVASIRDIDISPGLFSQGPWGKKLITVEGEQVSLNDIEHRILRPIWRDPRIHYAINCAAIGCPNLQPRPFTGQTLDHALDLAAMTYVDSPRGMRIEAGKLYVSSIYVWFVDDFGGDDAGVIRHLMAYAAPATAMKLQTLDDIAGHSYDWRLNDAGLDGR